MRSLLVFSPVQLTNDDVRVLQELEFALQIFNFFFTSVFILEAIVKIVALGLVRYLSDRSVWSFLARLLVYSLSAVKPSILQRNEQV